MSAYMVDDAHIDVLIDMAWQYDKRIHEMYPNRDGLRWRTPSGEERRLYDYTTTELGQMLITENARSVSYRYKEPQDPAALTYQYRATGRTFTPSQAIMAIAGYTYQACEHDDWERSEARNFCHQLREIVIAVGIPESPNDEWGWTDAMLGRSASITPGVNLKTPPAKVWVDVALHGEREDVMVSGAFAGTNDAGTMAVVRADDGGYHGFRNVQAFSEIEKGHAVHVRQHDGQTEVEEPDDAAMEPDAEAQPHVGLDDEAAL